MILSGNFIAGTKEYAKFNEHVPAPYLRKSFFIEKDVSAAEITICGLGFYDLFINGARVTKGIIAPYISNPDHIIYYDNYDISQYLTKGENVIGIILGNGMQNSIGGFIWDFDKVPWRSAPKVAMHMHVEFADGTEALDLEADESFKTAPSPILFDDLRCGEWYDATRSIANWNLQGFDDSEWSNAIKAENPRGERKLCTAEPIVKTQELKPVSITEYAGGLLSAERDDVPFYEKEDWQIVKDGFLYDFGVNTAGIPKLKIKGEKGQRVIMQFGELLKDGLMNLEPMNFEPIQYNHRIVFICSGDEDVYEPTFCYFGFRYCLVSGVTKEQATADLLTYKVMNSDIRERGGFVCSDPVANTLQEMTRRAVLANFYYFPTDCPHREKNGWTGDAALSAEHILMNLTAENSFRVWLDNVRKTQKETGELPGIVPTGDWGYDWGNGPAWDCALTYLPYYTYYYTGDTEILRENATAIFRYLNYITTKRDDDGLVHFGLGDWCPAGRDNPIAPLELTDTIICMDICEKAGKIFDVLGATLQGEFAKGLYNELRASAREHLIDKESMLAKGNCQTSQAMAIHYNVFDENEKAQAFENLLAMIHEKDDHLDVGILGARVIFHVLSDFGHTALAYKMITQPTFPSYGYWIKEGGTTLFEDFRLPEDAVNSKNHHFFGDISSWFIKNIAGLRYSPGKVEFKPNFIDGVDFAQGFFEAPEGMIKISWKRNENGEIDIETVSPFE